MQAKVKRPGLRIMQPVKVARFGTSSQIYVFGVQSFACMSKTERVINPSQPRYRLGGYDTKEFHGRK